MIIGISGVAGSGKDTLADMLVERGGCVKVALADPIKRMARDAFNFTVDQLWGDSSFRNRPDRRYPRRSDYWEYPACPAGAVWVPLFAGRGYTLINSDDFDVVTSQRWALNKKEDGKNTDYVRASIGGKKVSLHRFLIGPASEAVDHINGNGLDNRRENLRACSKAENRRNSEKRVDGESVFKGVGRVADRDGWRAYINVDGSQRTIGYFASEEEAALAYDDAARAAFGKFARLNSEKFLTPRYALQTLGSEWGRHCYPNVWVDHLIRAAEVIELGACYEAAVGLEPNPGPSSEGCSVVVSDVRFKNEIDALRAAGAYLIRIVRPGAGLGGVHASEMEQAEIPNRAFDMVVDNSGSLEDLKICAAQIFEALSLP